MTKFALCLLAGVVLAVGIQAKNAHAGHPKIADRWAARFARTRPWHGGYYHTAWGEPMALVVPPTANMQRSQGWGVTQSEMRPIYHQFKRPYPGMSGGGATFSPTPRWPSHTDQFGVYYIRGPW